MKDSLRFVLEVVLIYISITCVAIVLLSLPWIVREFLREF